MRILAEIPHPDCKISVFYMNQKYIVKFEKGNFEQSYKISELDYVKHGYFAIGMRSPPIGGAPLNFTLEYFGFVLTVRPAEHRQR